LISILRSSPVCNKVLLLTASLTLCAFSFQSDSLLTPTNTERTAREFDKLLSETSSPEFDALLSRHRAVVQKGYANVLLDELNHDSLSAIISFLKYRLHKTFSLPTTQLIKVIPLPKQELTVPIILDYPTGFIVIETGQDKIYRRVVDTIPNDPWEKETR